MNYGNILTTNWKTIWKEKVIIWFGMLMMLLPAFAGMLFGGILAFSNPGQLERFFTSGFEGVRGVIFFFGYFFFIALSFVMGELSFAGIFKGTLLAQTKNEPLAFYILWDASMPYLWRILGVMFIVGLVLGLVYLVPLLLLVLAGFLSAGVGFLCGVPLFLLLIPVGLVGYLLFSLSMAALIAEDSGVLEAIQSAWRVIKAKFWPLVLMIVILYVIQLGIGMVIAISIPMQTGNVDPNAMFRYFGFFMAFFIPISFILQGFGLTDVNGAWMISYLESSAAPALPTETEDEIIEYDA